MTSVLAELYNSSTSTQSPTRSLKSHVWSSSSGNNCHAVHRSHSSGASVYECTMGIFFTSSHFVSQFPPTWFPLITAIRMCHLLPVHYLGMAFLAGSKAKIQHYAWFSKCSTSLSSFLLLMYLVTSAVLCVIFWPSTRPKKCYSKVIHRKEVTHSSNRKRSRGRIKAYDMGQGEGPIVPLQWCTGRE